MVLINNIKNKIFDYIPEKKCPVCQKKMNKLVKKVYCSFMCYVRFEGGLIEFIMSLFFMLLVSFVANFFFKYLIYLFLIVVTTSVFIDILKSIN